MPTWRFRFLDGVIEEHCFSSFEMKEDGIDRLDRLDKKKLQTEMCKVMESWKITRGVVIPQQLVITHSESGKKPTFRVMDDEDFFVVILPLIEVTERLSEKDVDTIYRTEPFEKDDEPRNEDSYRNFTCVLWVDRRVGDSRGGTTDTIFYRRRHDGAVRAVSYYNPAPHHPCWEEHFLPLTELARARWEIVKQWK